LEIALADLVYKLPYRYHPGIVQQAQGSSAEMAVSPHHNNQSTIYNPFAREIMKRE
jgi:hypothetical protein